MPLVEDFGDIASFTIQFKAEFLSKWPIGFLSVFSVISD